MNNKYLRGIEMIKKHRSLFLKSFFTTVICVQLAKHGLTDVALTLTIGFLFIGLIDFLPIEK